MFYYNKNIKIKISTNNKFIKIDPPTQQFNYLNSNNLNNKVQKLEKKIKIKIYKIFILT